VTIKQELTRGDTNSYNSHSLIDKAEDNETIILWSLPRHSTAQESLNSLRFLQGSPLRVFAESIIPDAETYILLFAQVFQ